MASTSSNEYDNIKTRLQKETQKRRAEEQLRQDVEVKRQKQIFLPGKSIDERDIVVDLRRPQIKMEGGSGSMLATKQETSTIDPTVIEPHGSFVNSDLPNIKLEVDNSFVVKVEETLELDDYAFSENFEQIEQNESVVKQRDHEINLIPSEIKQTVIISETVKESEDERFLQNHIKLLKLLVQQKDQEIKLLAELAEGLQSLSNVLGNNSWNRKSENYQINTNDSSTGTNDAILEPNSDIEKVFKHLNLTLTNNDTIIRELSTKLLNLQSKIFGNPKFARHNYTHKISCIQCGSLCKSQKALRRHTIYQHTEKTLPCPHCKDKFHTEAQLNMHIKTHVNPEEWNWQCKLCLKKFLRQGKLNKHMKNHRRTKRSCSEESSNGDSLDISTQQQKTLTQQSTAAVVIEKERCTRKNRLKYVECDECWKRFKSEIYLRTHKMRFHSICQFSCRYCEKQFTENTLLIQHMENGHDSEILNKFDNEWELEPECESKEQMTTHTTDKPSNDDIVP